MIAYLKPYPAMKDSGVPWLGDVPEHWRELPGKLCYREKKVPNMGLKETTVLSLSYGQIVVKPVDKLHGLVPASFETYQIVDAGNIIVRPTDLQNDWSSLRFGLSRHRGIITSAYMCLLTTDTMMQDYGHLLLHAYDLKKVFYGLGSGLRQNLDWRDFKYLPCVVPPLPEQSAIVRFLDYMDRRIRKYIRIKQKLVKLLEEQKQAIIHRAVTRGLDPTVRLKPSGVEWLGKVPEHWEVGTLRRKLRSYDGIKIGPFGSQLKLDEISDSGYKVYGQANVIAKDFTRGTKFVNQQKFDELSACEVRSGDLVVTMMGTSGRCARIPEEAVTGIMDSHLLRLRTDASIDVSFAALIIDGAPYVKEQILVAGKGSIMHGLNSGMVKDIVLAIPPLHEQAVIVRFLDDTTAIIVAAIERAQREISLLHEYRTRLIADVVTGKLDVREAAANLPEETEEMEPLDEADALSDAEEETEVLEELEE